MNTIMRADQGKCMSKGNIKGGKSIIFKGGNYNWKNWIVTRK